MGILICSAVGLFIWLGLSMQMAAQPQSVTSHISQVYVEYARHKMADPMYDWKQPINFYGKVVDESNKPVASASVNYTWSTVDAERGTLTKRQNTDGSGLFSIHVRGKRIGMTVSKEGYYTPKSERLRSYEYANPADGLFTPDPNHPVVFHLRKKGQAEFLLHVAKTLRIPRNGTPVAVDLFSGKSVAIGQGQFEIRCMTSDQNDDRNRYDWHCSISVPNGGIIETKQEFPFAAPVDGYRASIEFNMARTNLNWSRSIHGEYFLKLPNAIYARLHFEMVSHGDHFCTVDCHINPSGSRNLEYDPTLQ
jgi:hypothetical protein